MSVLVPRHPFSVLNHIVLSFSLCPQPGDGEVTWEMTGRDDADSEPAVVPWTMQLFPDSPTFSHSRTRAPQCHALSLLWFQSAHKYTQKLIEGQTCSSEWLLSPFSVRYKGPEPSPAFPSKGNSCTNHLCGILDKGGWMLVCNTHLQEKMFSHLSAGPCIRGSEHELRQGVPAGQGWGKEPAQQSWVMSQQVPCVQAALFPGMSCIYLSCTCILPYGSNPWSKLPFLISNIIFITTEVRQAFYPFVLYRDKKPETLEEIMVLRGLRTQFTAVPLILPRTQSIRKPLLGASFLS